ncbi:fungal-specific transcription factor domain-containing protein [Thelonectria olida]|uniref:Fungal-specific transcription factor domain-containing protein n=1 Tax=Thelonectria olida TaxID=1576542 RepID=A0A9P9AUA4_9HYPO|nr:fungal-specific transcription factor domain-containing protein [Thelonectria olida]
MSAIATSPEDKQSAVSENGLKIWSCVICRRRKVRCDRRDPCSNCTKAGVECHYPVTGRVPRRRADPAAWRSPAQKQSELLSRLRRLETVVIELAGQVEDGPNAPSSHPATAHSSSVTVTGSTSSPDATQSDARSVVQSITSSGSEAFGVKATPAGSEFDEEFGRLVVDKDGSLHVGNRFWSVFCDEVDHIFEAMHDVADSAGLTDPSASEASSGGPHGKHSFVFGTANVGSLDALNPLPSQMLFIWQTYVDNVDPFLKILHVPSMEKVIRELKGTNFSSLGPNMEPLLFSICLAAIMSMDDESVVLNFSVPKQQLLARYRLSTEQALGRAAFLTTKEIAVVQALVIYLTVLFYLGANELAWPLIGSLLRVAKSLQLHRKDGARHCSPLEAELRRRLWWHICFLDSKSQKPGTRDLSLSESSFDTEMPGIVDDTDLDPTATSTIPIADQRLSSRMIPCLVRCELWQLVHSLQDNASESLQVKLRIYNDIKSRVARCYLCRIRSNGPLERYIRTMGSLFFAKADLVIHKSSTQPESQALVQAALKASITIITDVHSLITDPDWAQWRWQLAGHVPWHAIGIFLGQACRQPWGPESEQVWVTTKRLLDVASDEAKEDRLWRPLMQLIKSTEQHRATHIESHQTAATVQQEPIPTEIPAPQQWLSQGPQTTATDFPYLANELNQLELQSQDYGTEFPPVSASGLYSNSADPSLWSAATRFDGLGQPEAAVLGDLMPMDWNAWEETSGIDSMWNFL